MSMNLTMTNLVDALEERFEGYVSRENLEATAKEGMAAGHSIERTAILLTASLISAFEKEPAPEKKIYEVKFTGVKEMSPEIEKLIAALESQKCYR